MSDTETDTSSVASDNDGGSVTTIELSASDQTGTESSTETASGGDTFTGISVSGSIYFGTGNYSENSFDSDSFTEQNGSNTTLDPSGMLNGSSSSTGTDTDSWNGNRQDTDSMSTPGGDSDPVTVTDQDFGNTTTPKNITTSFSAGNSTESGGSTLQTTETHSYSESDPDLSYSDVTITNSAITTPAGEDGSTSSTGGSLTNSASGTLRDEASFTAAPTTPNAPSPNNGQTETDTGSSDAPETGAAEANRDLNTVPDTPAKPPAVNADLLVFLGSGSTNTTSPGTVQGAAVISQIGTPTCMACHGGLTAGLKTFDDLSSGDKAAIAMFGADKPQFTNDAGRVLQGGTGVVMVIGGLVAAPSSLGTSSIIILKGMDNIQASIFGSKTFTYMVTKDLTGSDRLALVADIASDGPHLVKGVVVGSFKSLSILVKPGMLLEESIVAKVAADAAVAAAKEAAEHPGQAAEIGAKALVTE